VENEAIQWVREMVLFLRFMNEWEKVHKFIEPIIIYTLYRITNHQNTIKTKQKIQHFLKECIFDIFSPF
jgi:hypothetical protein